MATHTPYLRSETDEAQPLVALYAAGVTPAKQDKRWRCQFRFWLDANKARERELGEFLMTLKQERKFASFMRDAVRLLKDLYEGNTDVLLELFPHVEQAIEARVRQQAPPPLSGAPADPGVKAELARLERMLLGQGMTPVDALEDGDIKIIDAPPAEGDGYHASAEEIMMNMADEMGNLFDD